MYKLTQGYRNLDRLTSFAHKAWLDTSHSCANSLRAPLIADQERSEIDNAIDLAIATQLSRRMPFVYGIVIVNLLLIANAFYGTASNWHLATATLPLLFVAGARALYWRPHALSRRSQARVSRDLQLLPMSGTAVALGLMIFGLSLYPLGNSQQQSLIHYIATLTSFVGILGLNPSPKTALGMTLVSVGPSTFVFLYLGHENAVAICITMISVSILLLVISRRQYDGFIQLIRSRAELQQREIEASLLADRLHRYAYFDELTGIPNRRAFLENFEARANEASKPYLWLALIDLDDFKTVNDLSGHGAGDAVLRAVAARIKGLVGAEYCGRLGGDEFGLILPGDVSQADAIKFAHELAATIAQPIEYAARTFTVKACVGLRNTEGLSVSSCIERADWALYKAKKGRSSVACFSSADEIIMEERSRIAKLFNSADLARELSIVYQPIINFDTSEIHALEVLSRWNTEDGTLIMPEFFIPFAESTRRSSELTRVVIKKSLGQLPAAYRGSEIHINLSVIDITDPGFVDWLANGDAFDIVPRSQIVLELTESAILSGGIVAAKNLDLLRSMKFQISLDDFGVGPSSLSRIHQLPLDEIKIDKSFCCEDTANEHGWAIVATILALSRQLGLECVLKGIENEQQALRARALGLRLLQGYYFSKPLSASQLGVFNVRGIATADAALQAVNSSCKL